MGTEWCMVDRASKTFYELGKGSWSKLSDFEALQDVEYLAHEILHNVHLVDEKDMRDEQKRKDWESYVLRIAADLHEAFKNTNPKDLRIIPDDTDDMGAVYARKYTCVGTRYGTKGTDYYSDCMEEANSHLDGGELANLYLLEDYQHHSFDWYDGKD